MSLEVFISFVVNNLVYSLSHLQIKLVVFMLMNLQLNITYKGEEKSTQFVALTFLYGCIKTYIENNCLDLDTPDSVSFVENDFILEQIEFSGISLRDFPEYLFSGQLPDDEEITHIVQAISELLTPKAEESA